MVARSINLAVIPGDGIGSEVVAEGLKVLSAVAPRHQLTVETTTYELGAKRWHETGETLPDSVEAELRQHDALFLGAVGDPSVPSGVLERGLLLRLRFNFAHYVNLRPVRLYPGVSTPLADVAPEDLNMLVVREGTEGPYAGMGGVIRKGTPDEIATQDSVNTRFGIERVVRYAFAKAAERPRKKLTLVHKDNVLTFAGELWQRVVREVGAEYPQVTTDYLHVDAATMFFVSDPARFDVIVTDNLFGDIITDLGAAVAGGIGLAASGNINPSNEAPSMFEPVHGSAPDIAGKGLADPTATILSLSLMLDHLGLGDAARQVEAAVSEDLEVRAKESGTRGTTQVGDDIAQRVAQQG
ncbi:3-isopropylmalate dehydrogenase [Spiractinospora alimapuensis]|uniref:3-isopropylmalate dehydrogenase n=1 Tax=Spiractinospora alimapuensis TaxID=2820884 RepID=UPI001EEA38A5|nr:3-isopropylmalate dehydrogenase [Spiractinospora alimapuensis]QVQ51627.1 3-isopropylmalate dehydrogenase [Spiractinospora alimapuensis]